MRTLTTVASHFIPVEYVETKLPGITTESLLAKDAKGFFDAAFRNKSNTGISNE
jgi:hypothetical protein